MKQGWILILALLLTGCAGLDQPAVMIDTGAKPAAALQPSSTASPTITATATPTATEIDWGALPITSTALQQAREANNLEGTRIAQVLEKQTVEAGWSNLTSTAAAATSTQSTSNTLTPEARAIATQNMAGTMTPEAAINVATVEKLQTETRMITLRESVWVVVSVIVGFWALAAIFRRDKKATPHPPVESTPGPQQQKKEMTVKLDTRDEYGWGAVDWSTCPVDLETLKAVANLIVGGAHYVQAHMTGADRPLVKDGNYNTLGDWLKTNKVMLKTNDGRYIIRHHEFFEQVLEK